MKHEKIPKKETHDLIEYVDKQATLTYQLKIEDAETYGRWLAYTDILDKLHTIDMKYAG